MTINYYEYINSDEWYKISEPVRKRNGGICECCNMRFIQVVHHRTYKNLGKEQPEDMLGSCVPCHEMIHRIRKHFIWNSRKPFLEQLQKEADKECNNVRSS